MTIKLFRAVTHTEVNIGDKVTSFRGEVAKVTGWATNGRNRVYVKEDGYEAEYYPSVYDCYLATEPKGL
jgi:hypothetical protein